MPLDLWLSLGLELVAEGDTAPTPSTQPCPLGWGLFSRDGVGEVRGVALAVCTRVLGSLFTWNTPALPANALLVTGA